jgi:hypothetical protein
VRQYSKPDSGHVLLGQPFSFPFEISQPLFDFPNGKGFATLCALVLLISPFIVDELIRKIDAVKPNREIVDSLEILVLAKVTEKIILYEIHRLHLLFR